MIELTIEELKERLSRLEETLLLDLLGIRSQMLVEAFEDLIIEQQNKLRGMIDD